MDEDKVYKLIIRHDSITNWTINNPILALGEYAVEDDTHRIKRGDGQKAWNDLPYETFGLENLIPLIATEEIMQEVRVLIDNLKNTEIKNLEERVTALEEKEIEETVEEELK